jgi:hypothetical protein
VHPDKNKGAEESDRVMKYCNEKKDNFKEVFLSPVAQVTVVT